MLTFLLILAVVCLALFTSLKIAFLLFLGLVAIAVIAIASVIFWSLRFADEADKGHGPLDRVLFGGEE